MKPLRADFGSVRDIFQGMEVRLVFKGVTYELLTNSQFADVARKAMPNLQLFHEEFQAARSINRETGVVDVS